MGKEHSKSAEASYVTRHRAMGRCVSCVGHIKIANQTNRGIQLVGTPDDWDQEHVQVGRHMVTGLGCPYMMPQVMVQRRYMTGNGMRAPVHDAPGHGATEVPDNRWCIEQ